MTIFCLLIFFHANAWVYPEHRQIGLLAIQALSNGNRIVLDNLWAQARRGYEIRLTESVIDAGQGLKPAQLDYASWLAIGGDHSCSASDLLHNALETEWILKVAAVAAQLKMEIADAKNASQHINAIRESDIRFQRADPDYASRASSNNGHFLIARPNVNTTEEEYIRACFQQGAELNVLGTYAWFHVNAMMKAALYANGGMPDSEKSALIRAALADEAFALHFLEDVFAAGHIAGTWGATSVRKGTHDYYNEKGLEVVTWDGQHMILMGDAYMRPEDAEKAAAVVRLSLEQFLDVASGKRQLNNKSGDAQKIVADSFNVCGNTVNPITETPPDYLMEVIRKTPVPGLATGLGELPRFRSELGTFFGVSTALNGNLNYGGFGPFESENNLVGGIEVNARWGFGLEGVLNQSGDGLVFIQAGWRLDGPSSSHFNIPEGPNGEGMSTPMIPGRSAFNVRLRIPFYVIPCDLILATPLLVFLSPKKLERMAVTAANGGLIPWQSAFQTPIGRLQFVLGREVGISFYGLDSPPDEMIIPVNLPRNVRISYKSTQFDFPIFEYRPFRTFSMNQASAMLVQVTGGFDIPYAVKVISPDNEQKPTLRTVWHLGVRVMFNWRHYY